jgi:hypothetical protein
MRGGGAGMNLSISSLNIERRNDLDESNNVDQNISVQ